MVIDMNNAATRREEAIQHAEETLADSRDDAEMRRDDAHAQDAEDRVEQAQRDEFDFMDDRPTPGVQRALDSARQSRFCQERFHGSGSAELDAAFGPDKDDEPELSDDEDDFV